MKLESELQLHIVSADCEVELRSTEQQMMEVTGNLEELGPAQDKESEDVPDATNEGAVQMNFIARMTKPVPPPMLPTPAPKKKVVPVEDEGDTTVRRSGRLAVKQKKAGHKKSEELAQEVLAKKLGLLTPSEEMDNTVKTHLLKLLGGPLPKETMKGMEELLMAMNIDGKVTPIKKGKVAACKGK